MEKSLLKSEKYIFNISHLIFRQAGGQISNSWLLLLSNSSLFSALMSHLPLLFLHSAMIRPRLWPRPRPIQDRPPGVPLCPRASEKAGAQPWEQGAIVVTLRDVRVAWQHLLKRLRRGRRNCQWGMFPKTEWFTSPLVLWERHLPCDQDGYVWGIHTVRLSLWTSENKMNVDKVSRIMDIDIDSPGWPPPGGWQTWGRCQRRARGPGPASCRGGGCRGSTTSGQQLPAKQNKFCSMST